MRLETTGWGCVMVACAAVVAAFSFLASVNEYASMFGEELAAANDCNGPATVLMLSTPAVLLAIAGVVLSIRALRARRSVLAMIAVCLGVAVLSAIAGRAPDVAAELWKNSRPDSPCR
jgi:hypothetical protein